MVETDASVFFHST